MTWACSLACEYTYYLSLNIFYLKGPLERAHIHNIAETELGVVCPFLLSPTETSSGDLKMGHVHLFVLSYMAIVY